MFRILKDHAHLHTQITKIIIFLINILSIKVDRAFRRLQQPVQMLDQGRLSGPGMPDHADKFTVTDLQIHMIQCCDLICCFFTVTIRYII